VIKDTIESRIELIDSSVGEEVRLRNCDIATVVGDVLRAGKKRLARRSPGNRPGTNDTA